MPQERFESCLRFVLKWEGSAFTNDPVDHGGATRFGITQREYDSFRAGQGQSRRSVEFIQEEEYRAIYRRNYWQAVKGDSMPPPVDLAMFDTGVLMGSGRAAKLLQAALDVEVDGAIGRDTLQALEADDPQDVAERMLAGREARLHAIVANDPTQQRFIRGWLNRLNDLRRATGVTAESAMPTEPASPGTAGIEDSVGNEDASDGAKGRADQVLPGDAAEEVPALPSSLSMLRRTDVAEFLAGARNLFAPGAEIYLIDVAASSVDALRASFAHGAAVKAFDIPAAAVESVTPLGVHAAASPMLLAAVSFKPGLTMLAATFRRLAGVAAAPAGSMFATLPSASDDPAAPRAGERSAETDLAAAAQLANHGGADAEGEGETPGAETEAASTTALSLDIGKAFAFLNACMTSSPRVAYGLGAKVPFFGAVPGRDFNRVDCSGFVREAIRRATEPRLAFPDGSVVQHDWVRARGFALESPNAGMQRDGAVRIAFLRPQDVPSRIGHVVLIHNGRTLESHGGVGPDSRPWTATSWQARTSVYVLVGG